MVKIWKAKEATFVHDKASDVTILTSAALDTFFGAGTEMQQLLKNVTITEPESDLNVLSLVGLDANNYQNQEFDEQPFTGGTISGTAILTDAANLEEYAYGAGATINATHTRFSPGKVSSKVAAIFLVSLDTATTGVGASTNKSVSFVLDNAWVTKLGETRLSDVAGHFERDFTAICLPKDFHGPEWED